MALILLLVSCSGVPKPVDDTGGAQDTDTGDTHDTDSGGTDTEDTDSGAPDDTGPVLDLDGDGHLSFADGGDDCDDLDPTVYPSAQEFCDDKDHDCDGDPLEPGVCGQPLSPEASSRWLVHDPTAKAGSLGVVGDVTGDGAADFIVGLAPSDGYGVFPGGSWPSSAFAVPEEAFITLTSPAAIGARRNFDAGDVDGDGLADIGLVAHDPPGLYVHLAPFASGGALDGREDADVYVQGDGESWGYRAVGSLDFDGDGRADAMSDALYGSTDLNVFFGMNPERCDLGSGGSTSAWAIGDPTGDGLDDLAVYSALAHRTWLLDGSLLRESCGAEPEDLAFARSGEQLDWDELLSGPWASVGDWSGDGLDDMVIGQHRSSRGGDFSGELLFFAGGLSSDFAAEDPDGSILGEEGFYLGEYLWSEDFDGDLTADLIVECCNSTLVIRGGEMPPPRSWLPDHYLAYPTNDDHTLGATTILSPGDFDGDGRADIVSYRRSEEYIDVGAIAGFEVPWDDDQYW